MKNFIGNGLVDEVQLHCQQEALKTTCDFYLCNGKTSRIGVRFTCGTSSLRTRLRKN